MSHLDERQLLEVRDGMLVAEEIRTHLDSCARCRAALHRAEVRASSISAVLATLDDPVDTTAAREVIRTRITDSGARADTPSARPTRGFPRTFGRAAALVLVTAGAAYALPGSPLRGWLPEIGTGSRTEAVSSPTGAAVDAGGSSAGVRLPVSGTPVDVVLVNVGVGTRIEVVRATDRVVSVMAPAGSTFATGPAQVRATVTEGVVRIEGPWEELRSVTVNERVLLERMNDRWEITGSVEEVSDARVVLVTGNREAP